MYKEIIISVVVITTIFILNWILQDYTKNSVLSITSALEELKDNLREGDTEKTEQKLEEIKEEWENKQTILAIFIEHNELEKVETNMVALEGYIEVGDYDTGINELNKSVFVLEHIAEKYDFSLVNVF